MDAIFDCDGERRCPVDFTLKMVGGKWKPLILHLLSEGTLRFGQLQRAIPNVTQRVLTLQLRELEQDGLLIRTVFPEVPPRVEYSLTPPALRLVPILDGLGQWLRAHRGVLGSPKLPPIADGTEAAPESQAGE